MRYKRSVGEKLHALRMKEDRLIDKVRVLGRERAGIKLEMERQLQMLTRTLGAFGQTYEDDWTYAELAAVAKAPENADQTRVFLEQASKRAYRNYEDMLHAQQEFEKRGGRKLNKLLKDLETTQVAIRVLGGKPLHIDYERFRE